MCTPNLKAKEYKKFEELSMLEKMEANIGVQENLLQYLIIPMAKLSKGH